MPTFNTRQAFEEAYPNVKGSAIGPNGELLVLVTEKKAESDLTSDEIVPDEVTIDGTTRETDLIPVGIPHLISASEGGSVEWYATAPEDHRRRYRPIPGGVSIGNDSIGAGTMGSPLLETEDGSPVTLTNAHVAGEAYEQFQPASMDGGAEAEPIGTLRDASYLDPNETQTTDSALIDVDPEDIDDTILGIGPLTGFDRADFTHDQYTKAGRTTGVTEAPLRGVDANVRVTYGPKTILFEGCDVFGDLSAPGDSGSLIGYGDENENEDDDGLVATSLLFAGSSVATIGIPLSAVQDYHGKLTIPSEEDDSGNGNGRDGSDDSSDDSSGGGSDDGSNDNDNGDSDDGENDNDNDNDNGDQDHTPEKTFEDYVEELLIEEYGEENVKRQYYFSYSGRYADLVVFDPEHERMEGWELENDRRSVLDGSGQARYYATELHYEFPEKGAAIPVLCIPDGHIDPEERHIIERSGVTVREIETPENVSLGGV